MNTNTSPSNAVAGFNRLYWWVAALLGLLLLLSWFMGYGPGGSSCKAPMVAAAPAPMPAPVVAPAPPPPPAPVAAPVVAAAPVEIPPAAKLYFAVDKTALPATTDGTLADVVGYLKRNASAKAVVSGFHDPTGNADRNHELAKGRAMEVGAALEKAGIGKDRIVMEKPVSEQGTGNNQEARRVEVSVKP